MHTKTHLNRNKDRLDLIFQKTTIIIHLNLGPGEVIGNRPNFNQTVKPDHVMMKLLYGVMAVSRKDLLYLFFSQRH